MVFRFCFLALQPNNAFIHAEYCFYSGQMHFYSASILLLFRLDRSCCLLTGRGEKKIIFRNTFLAFFCGAISRLYLYTPKMAKKANF